jgi:chemotaxis protein methyltransferase CheR
MSSLSIRPIAFRHVNFPGADAGSGPPLNFTPPDHAGAPVGCGPDNLSLDEFQSIQWLFQRGGIRVEDYRLETMKRRIPACLRALRLETLDDVCAAVQHQPELLKRALSALVIGVTSFFRDPAVFAALKDSFLAEILARSPAPRIWSAGCSDGAELYSLAMLLAERGAIQRCCLLGTDCRHDAVNFAREGCYDSAAVRHVPAELMDRYFKFEEVGWRVHPFLRAVIQWRSANVLTTPEPGQWDLILCRNLAIYMQPPATAQLWRQLEQFLRPGGILVLGKAERPAGAAELVPVAPCIYRRNR